jgi:hypothetical protein
MPKSKWSVFFSLLLVFFSGAVVGVFATRLYIVKNVIGGSVERPGPPRRDPEEVRRTIIAEMRSEVKLDDQQVAQLNQIYDQTREQADQLHKKANAEMRGVWDNQTARIKAMLRPDQVVLYDTLRARHEAEREKERKRRQAAGDFKK